MSFKQVITALRRGDLGEGLRRGLLNGVANSSLMPKRPRTIMMRLCGIKVGRGTFIFPGIYFNGTDVILEDGVAINRGCIFDRGARIHLEKNVHVGFNVLFACASHRIGPSDERAPGWYAEPIHVGKGTWLGANCVLFPGVTVAPGCVVAAGTVINKDLDTPNAIYAGSPAKLLKLIDDDAATGSSGAGTA